MRFGSDGICWVVKILTSSELAFELRYRKSLGSSVYLYVYEMYRYSEQEELSITACTQSTCLIMRFTYFRRY